jgi:hypothetical protein
VVDRAQLATGALAGILLVGGSSRIPLVASRLHARFGVAPIAPEQPELPVAYGAGLVTVPAPTSPASVPSGVSTWAMPRPGPVWASPALPAYGPILASPVRKSRRGLTITVIALIVMAVILTTCCRGCYSFLSGITVVDPSASQSASAPPSSAVAIRSTKTLLCVDFAGAGQGAAAQQDVCADDPAQRWRSTPTAAGVTLTNAATGQCLDVDQALVDDGAKVQQWACDDGPNQQWKPQPVAGSTAVLLVNVNSGKCLDLPDGRAAPGTALLQKTCTGATNQQWTIGP